MNILLKTAQRILSETHDGDVTFNIEFKGNIPLKTQRALEF